MTGQEVDLTAVVPLLNEQEVVPELVRRLGAALAPLGSCEIVLVDDGSTDRTFETLKEVVGDDERFVLVRLTRNFGQHAAITAGLDHARGELVIVLDGDLQDPPEEIPAFLETARKSGADVVYGLREERKDSWFRRLGSGVFKGLLRRALPSRLPANIGTFRLLSRRVVDSFLALPERTRYVTGLIDWLGYPHAFHPFQREARAGGRSSYGVRQLMALAFKGMTSFSDWPIRLCSRIGLLMAGASFGVGLYFLVKKLVFGKAVTGFSTLIVSITFIGGVQLLFLGVVGLYVSRIFEEVKARPLFVVAEVHSKPPARDEG